MKRLIFIILVYTLPVHLALAQRVDIITTRNGDVYEGYISHQTPSKSLTIQSMKTIMTVAARDAEKTMVRKSMLGDLSEEYILLFPLMPDDSYVELADIKVTDKVGREMTFKNSVILEDGENIKFVSFAPHSQELKWSDIRVSGKVPYDFSDPHSICERLTLPNGEYFDGQLIEQDLLSGIIKFRMKDGNVVSFRKSKVLSIRYGLKDSDEDIWSKLPYCDKVVLKDGTFEDGFIVSKTFSDNVTVQQFNSEFSRDIPVRDIVSYEKYPNPMYSEPEEEKREEVLADLYVNGISFPLERLLNDRGTYCVDNQADSLKIIARTHERIVVKFKASTRTNQVMVMNTKLMKERVMGISGLKFKRRGTELWPVFTLADQIMSPDINFQSNDREFITVDIAFDTPGVYVLWVYGSEKCIAIKVN